MVVDAMDLCSAKQHIDIFALLTGDSDFSPLVSKLKENNKRVIGCGVKNSTSNLLIANCDEFIYYDDLVRQSQKSGPSRGGSKRREADKVDRKEKGRAAPEAAAAADKGAEVAGSVEKNPEAMDQLLEILESLNLDYDPIWGSMIKQTIRRVYPGFNEAYYGYRNFADLLKDAEGQGYIELEYDEGRGNFKVRLLDY
jgi:hypothetical protein